MHACAHVCVHAMRARVHACMHAGLAKAQSAVAQFNWLHRRQQVWSQMELDGTAQIFSVNGPSWLTDPSLSVGARSLPS